MSSLHFEFLPNGLFLDQIKAKFPYYWRMRDLNIGNPKLEPQLTVNGGTKLDVMAILGTNPSDLDEPEEQDSGVSVQMFVTFISLTWTTAPFRAMGRCRCS